MIELGTNVLVRYLTQDDPDQAALAMRVVDQELTEDAPASPAWPYWSRRPGFCSGYIGQVPRKSGKR